MPESLFICYDGNPNISQKVTQDTNVKSMEDFMIRLLL